MGGEETKLAAVSIIKQLLSSNIYMVMAGGFFWFFIDQSHCLVKKLISDTDDLPDHHQLIIHRKTQTERDPLPCRVSEVLR